MGRNYGLKRQGFEVPNRFKIEEARKKQEANRRARLSAEEYVNIDDLPLVLIKFREIYCPYQSCQHKQNRIVVGVQTCSNPRCERKFVVPDSPAIQEALAATCLRKDKEEAQSSSFDELFMERYQ